MKRLFSFSSIVLTILLVMTSLTSVNVFAGSSDPRLTVGNGSSYNVDIGVSSAAELSVTDTKILKSSGVSTVTSNLSSVNNNNILIYKFSIPKASVGKQLDKFVFRFSHSYDENTASWNFKKIPGESIDNVALDSVKANANANDSAFEKKYHRTISDKKVTIITVDISSYVKECSRAGQESFYIALYNSSTVQVWNLADGTVNASTSGFNGADVKPYGYYTEEDAGELAFLSVTNPTTSDEGVRYTFTNPISATSVSPSNFSVTDLSGESISVSNDDISVSGSAVTLDMDWAAYGYYTVAFNGMISDIYGQKIELNNSVSFEVSADIMTTSATGVNTFGMNSDNGVVNVGSTGKIIGKSNYVLYKFDLSQIGTSKTVIGADFRWSSERSGSRTINVTQVPNGTWTDADSLAADITDRNYYNVVDEAMKSDACVVGSINVSFGSSYTTITHTVDVSDAVSKAINGNSSSKYITFAFTDVSTHNFYPLGHSTDAYNPSLTLTLVEPSFDAVETSPSKCGVMDGVGDNIEVTLATAIDNDYANDTYIQLQDMNNNVVDASISVKASKIVINPVADLASHTEYKVVLKNGIKDVSENELDNGDKVIHRFTTGSALVFNEIKFTTDLSPVYDMVNVISSYDAGDSVTAVTKFENTSENDLPALMIIAIYGSDDSLIKVDAVGGPFDAQANQVIQFSKAIEVPSDAVDTYIKAFAWNGLDDMRPLCGEGIIRQASSN